MRYFQLNKFGIKFIRAWSYFLSSIIFLYVWSGNLHAKDNFLNLKESNGCFLQNNGQWVSPVLFQGRSFASNVYLLKDGVSFSQRGSSKSNAVDFPFQVWNMKFLSMNPSLKINGIDGRKSVYSYLSGNNESEWVQNPYEFKRVEYTDIYPKIDLVFYGSENELEYDYIMHPGSKIENIKSYFEGIDFLKINGEGHLEIKSNNFLQIQKAPISWQIVNGVKKFITVEYRLFNDSTFGFDIKSDYDAQLDLFIDPLFQMVWSSYTQIPGSGNNINYCFSNAMDIYGNVYLTGMVDGSFPITPGAYSGPGNVYPEVFVAKFSNDGTTLLYWTYLPGSSSEFGGSIEVDSLGRAYVTGVVDLNITGLTNFPSTPNAYQPVHSTNSDAYLTVLNPAGSSLVYSSFLGGTGSETGYDIALGPLGIAYVTGFTTGFGTFPVKASSTFPTGDNQVFVAKFDINQSGSNSLVYSTRIGGGAFTYAKGRSIAVNSAGNVFVTGSLYTSTSAPIYPTTPGAYNNVFNTGQDGVMSFVTKLSNTLPITLTYSTFLTPGGANGIDVNPLTDEVFVVGTTETFAFPVTTGALQTIHGGVGGSDAYVVKLNAAGTNLEYATFIGGPSWDNGTAIVANSAGEVYVTGLAELNFPTSVGSIQPNFAGGWKDLFVVHLNATGTGYGCGGSTLVGGSDADYSGAFYDYPSPQISIRDHNGINDSISISSTSHSQDFPTTPGAYGPIKVNGIADQPVFFKMTCYVQQVLPNAGFTFQSNVNCQQSVVSFTDTSTSNPNSWFWSFPGGIPSSSNLQNPQNIQYTSAGNYPIQLVVCNGAGCDTITDTIVVSVLQAASVALGNDTVICDGNILTIVAPVGYTLYQWALNSTPVGNNTNSLLVSQSGNYSIVVTNGDGCTATDSQLISLANPVVNLGPDFILCLGDTEIINATAGFSSYQWFYNGTNLGSIADSIIANQSGIYEVMVTDNFGCMDRDTVSVASSLVIAFAGNDTAICLTDSVQLSGSGSVGTYQWLYNGSVIGSTSVLWTHLPGSYLLSITNMDGCVAKDSVDLIVWPLPILNSIEDTIICEGQSVLLATQGAQQYNWTPSTFLSSPNVSSPLCTPLNSISYLVSGLDQNGCSASDTVNVILNANPNAEFTQTMRLVCDGVELITNNTSSNATNYLWNFGDGTSSQEWSPSHFYSSVNQILIQLIALNGICRDTFEIDSLNFDYPLFDSIPNVITPNGDNLNECFKISDLQELDNCYSLDIFNRWGKMVFQSNSISDCWNGKSKNNIEFPEGVYFYVLKIGVINKKGIIHLFR